MQARVPSDPDGAGPIPAGQGPAGQEQVGRTPTARVGPTLDGRWGWGEQECYREMVLISCDEEIGEYSGVRLGIMRSLFTIEQKLYCILSTEKKNVQPKN